MTKDRTIIQINNGPEDIAALCDDGSIWVGRKEPHGWRWALLPAPRETKARESGWYGKTFILPNGEAA